jgi:PilZ domain
MVKVEERRRFFRIDDEVNLVYKKIDEKAAAEPSYISDHILNNCSLSAAIEMMSQESASLLNRLERNQPDVVDYLRLLDNKIDLLVQAIMMQGSQVTGKNTRNANLSAAGLAFESEEALNPGEYLEIKMTLVSCMAVIVTYGKVIYCKLNPANDSQFPYVVGVDYINMKEQDRELLIKHVVKRQLQQIRDKKEQNNAQLSLD